jgi:hypothetical protein
MEDQDYAEFIIRILRALEPKIETEESMLFEELDEINEVIFILDGVIDLGFQINKIKRYVLRFDCNFVIGAYNCTFNERSSFIYKCRTQCTGYYLRKHTWKELLNEYP